MYYLSILIATVGLVSYQLFIKRVSSTVNPFLLLTVVYLIAAVICFPAAVVWKHYIRSAPPVLSVTTFRGAASIAFAIIFIEMGYLLAYRAGWLVALAPAFAQAITLASLFVIGLMFFSEKVTLVKTLGLALAIVGILLLSRRS